jgi:arylsulfatase A-like enzyme
MTFMKQRHSTAIYYLTAPLCLSYLIGCGGGAVTCDDSPDCTDETGVTTTITDTADTSETGTTSGLPIVERSTPWNNLLFITLDTLRRDRVTPSLMPNLSSILDESVVLNNNRACSNWTFVSMGCLLTGSSSIDQGFVPMDITDYPDSVTMFPELLQGEGFFSKMVGSHVLLSIGNLFQGFDQTMNLNPAHADTVTEMALSGLSELENHPRWFYYLHYQDPHQPFSAPDSYVPNFDSLPTTAAIDWRSSDLPSLLEPRWPIAPSHERDDIITNLNAYYNGEVAYMDESLGVLWQGLLDSGALENTLVVFMSDHGEQLYDHDGFTHDVDIYTEETANIVAFWAEGLPPRWVELPTANKDIAPTIMHALGLGIPAEMTGALVGTLEDVRALFSVTADEYFGISQSVEVSGQRLIYRWSGERERYDIIADSAETIDIFGQDSASDDALFSLLLPEINALDTIMVDYSPSGL